MTLEPTLQGLPPEHARLCLRVEAFLRGLLPFDPKGMSLLLAVSGGLDSSALAVILNALAPRLGARLVAAHLDHGLRPDSADEARRAASFCAKLGLACRIERRDAAEFARRQGLGLEAAGRKLRYAFLEQARQEAGADLVLTGHQQNDLAEDVLMRLTRGAGWPGLGGMSAFDPGRALLRPLLRTPRSALRALLTGLGLDHLEDPSNADQRFFRNRVRHEILPLFLRENPDFLETAGRLWDQARQDRDYFEQTLPPLDLTPRTTAGGGREILLPRQTLAALHPALRLRLYKKALNALGPGQALAASLFALEAAFLEKRHGALFQFPGAKSVELSAMGARFFRATSAG